MNYFLISLLSFIVTAILTPILRWLGEKYYLYDEPVGDELKIHKKPVSYLGGLAILAATICSFTVGTFLTQGIILKIIAISSGAIIISLFGFWDDMRWKHISQIKPKLKLLMLIVFSVLITVIFIVSGIKIWFLPYSILAGILVFFYILGLINAINFQDGMDGLAGGLVAISALGFAILSDWNGNELGMVLSMALFGACLGFLIYNFNPASIFMGDSGSYFLGAIIAALAIIFTSQPYNLRWLIGPWLIIGLPIFDTGLAIVRRLVHGKSPFLGDRGHLYDRLHRQGFSIRKTVLICYLIQAIFVAGGLLILK